MSQALHIVLAGLVAIGATVAVERFGGRLGGILGSLPTTIVPASLGLAAAGSGAAVHDAMAVVPVGMALNAGFLWLWRVIPPHLPASSLPVRLAVMTALSIGAWFIAALVTVVGTDWLVARGVSVAWLGAVAALGLMLAGLAMCRDLPPAPRGTRRVGPLTLLMRGVLAATAIGTALALAHFVGPVAAGVASVFPAIFVTTMVSLWLSQGEAVPLGAIGPIVLGSSAVSTYALVAATLMPSLGTLGAVIAWIIAVVGISLPAATLLRLRRPVVSIQPSESPTPVL